MKEFMFITSIGMVKCTIDTKKDKIAILDGEEHLDKLYRWDELSLEDGWIKIYLTDGYYGCPEYKVIY